MYINNINNNVLIETFNNDTFKQFVQTTVLVHASIGNGNTLIYSQPSLRGLSFRCVSNLSRHQQLATLHFITANMHNNEWQALAICV